MTDYIKCNKCGGEGYKYIFQKRWYFKCFCCGHNIHLKLLNVKDGKTAKN